MTIASQGYDVQKAPSKVSIVVCCWLLVDNSCVVVTSGCVVQVEGAAKFRKERNRSP